MNGYPDTEEMRRIAASFAGLLRLLTHNGETERPKDIRDLLIDRLRDTLDRRLPSLTDDAPTFIGNSFLVEAVVHRNGRTEISRLRHRDLGTLHAMKTIGIDRANDAAAAALLLREARIGTLLCNSNLAAARCAIRLPDGRPAIIMEWIGPSLSQRLAAGTLSSVDIRTATKSLLLGLGAIHEAGYVHGDISPANLLLRDGDFNQLKIADFGTVRERGACYQDLGIAKSATPGFTAPEISANSAADPRADLYSAGCVISLLLDHCDDAGETVEQLKALALRLMADCRSKRPPDALAALASMNEA